jgi:exodeoxyribonuclease VII large subunit
MRTLSYESVLERGFAVVFDAEGKPVKQAASVSAGDALSIRFRDGDIAVVAGEGDGSEPAKLVQTKKVQSPGSGNQGSLF